MPLNANTFITLSEAKIDLKLLVDTYDPKLERLINGLTATFEREVGRKIKKQTLTNYRVNGNGLTSFRPAFLPVQSVASIQLRYDYDNSIYLTITDPTKFYIIEKKDIVLLDNEVFLSGVGNVLLTMDVGYNDSDPEMSTYKELILMQVVYDFKRWDLYEAGITSRSFQDGSTVYAPSVQLLKEVRDGLDHLKELAI